MNKPRRAIAALGYVLVLALAVSACAEDEPVGDNESGGEPITLAYNEFTAENSPQGRGSIAFMDEVEEVSDGALTFDRYFSSSLVPVEEVLEAVRSGLVDITYINPGQFVEELPIAAWLQALGSGQTSSFPAGYLQGAMANLQMFLTSEALEEEFAQHNMKILSAGSTPNFALGCTKKVETLADAKGVRTRTGVPVHTAEVEAMGMVPQAIPFLETYEALQRGVVDCAVMQPSHLRDFSFWEVVDTLLPVPLSPSPSLIYVINLERWESLSPEQQEQLQQGALTGLGETIRAELEGYQEVAETGPSDHGISVADPRELDSVIAEHQEKVRASLAETAPDSLPDAQVFVDEYLAALDEWLTLVTEDASVELTERDPEAILESLGAGADVNVQGVIDLAQERFGR